MAVGNNQFSADVYKELLKTSSGNHLVCTLSIEIVLALVHAGARGETAQQLSNALHLPKTAEEIKKAFKNLEDSFHDKPYTVSSANKIYVKKGYEITDQFKKTALEDFSAEIENIDFEKPQEAASEINKWVEEKTCDKIKDIVQPDELSDRVCVLINAMYFHGNWLNTFDEDSTVERPFYLSNGNTTNVNMMGQVSYFHYSEDSNLDAKFLIMRYQGWIASMVLVLPNDRNGLVDLESRISEVLDIRKYDNVRVDVQIPKFKIESDIKLVPVLKALGILDAFEDCANFSKIIANLPLKISEVKQKAFIDVNEEGTTAAAATDVEMMAGCSMMEPPKPIEFIADHPFIFILKIEDTVFFLGRCVSPTY